ncbi:uncharacterized protein LOC5513112 isoform X3 [Nematostella vectensis]|uniref:uncharacterized protein LOC5513112 isoform X3 n=1 Tax=Nematostella vectensis TaxID=45351 RepID=UPI00207716E5|nr:uncharacterized protein LOC5513112 isoform X3 [Nematostella vectensis]
MDIKVMLLWKILAIAVFFTVVDSGRHRNLRRNIRKDVIASNGEAVTFFVMGNPSNEDTEQNVPTKRVDESNIKASNKDTISSIKDRSAPTGVAKKKTVPVHHKKTKKKSKKSSRGNIGSINDIQSAYRHGIDVDAENSLERVKMIDDGALTDYFHAINGEDNKQNAESDDQGTSPENTESNEVSQSTDLPQAKMGDTPGIEVYTDNPEDEQDDFYAAINRGKKTPPLMKEMRPTKSHFADVPEQHWKPRHVYSDRLSYNSNDEMTPSEVTHGNAGFASALTDTEDHNEVSKANNLDTKEHGVQDAGRHNEAGSDNKPKEDSPKAGDSAGANMASVNTAKVEKSKATDTAKQDGSKSTNTSTNSSKQNSNVTTSDQKSAPKEQTKGIPASQDQSKDGEFGMGSPFLSNPFVNPFSLFEFNKPHKQQDSKTTKSPNIQVPMKGIKGTQIVGGKITGGRIVGGFIQGGNIVSGDIEGGVIKGGQVEGGKFLNGTMEGGLLHDGVIDGGRFVNGTFEGGYMKDGIVSGGKIKGGRIEGGEIEGGLLIGGRFRGGRLQGGVMRGGEVVGGMIKGGNIEGGIMTGGSVEGGSLKEGKMSGGTLKAGAMFGGEMKNGSIEGGILKSGIISGGILKGGTIEGGELRGGVVLAGKIKGGIVEGGVIEGGEIGEGVIVKSGHINGTIVAVHSDRAGAPPPLIVKEPKHVDDSVQAGKKASSKTSNGGKLKSSQTESFTSVRNGKHHVVFDGISFDVPEDGFSDLISRMNGNPNDLENLLNTDNETIGHSTIEQQTQFTDKPTDKPTEQTPTSKVTSAAMETKSSGAHDDSGIKPEDIINKLSPTEGQSASQAPFVHVHAKDSAVKPTYHWSLSSLLDERIPGSPGSAMITHGHVQPTRGGLAFNGEDAWLGGGDYAGGCISAPDTCADGFSFEMTLKMDKDAINTNDMNYIVDSGASTFNSKGFSLYTLHGKLRADIAIPNDAICLETPMEPDRWHDVLVTWKKDQGLRMYMNCELKAETKSNDHCLGCRSTGCHVSDYNTKLMIGRPNYSPHFHCTKFESGDISFWERYLSPADVSNICAKDTVMLNDAIPSKEPIKTINPEAKPVILKGTTQEGVVSTPLIAPLDTQAQPQPVQLQQVVPLPQGKYLPQTPKIYGKAPFIGPQTITPNANGEYEVKFPSMMQIGKTYEFDQVIPAMRAPPPQPYNSYQQQQPMQNPMMQGGLYSSPASYASGVGRDSVQAAGTVPKYFTQWSRWSACSKSCGYGVRARKRTCLNPRILLAGRVCSGPSIQHGFCFQAPCPGSTRSQARKSLVRQILRSMVNNFALQMATHPTIDKTFLGTASHANVIKSKTAEEPGTTRQLHESDHGGYGLWSLWGSCSKLCGTGTQLRTRICHSRKSCVGPSTQVRHCNPQPCPSSTRSQARKSLVRQILRSMVNNFALQMATHPTIDKTFLGTASHANVIKSKTAEEPGTTRQLHESDHGGYGLWSLWGSCSKLCGTGTQLRTRICHSRKSCVGPSTQVRHCNPQPCPSTCYVLRATMSKYVLRVTCYVQPCPVDGGFNDWSEFSLCTKTCGARAMRFRLRSCDNPQPAFGGKPCAGPTKQTIPCGKLPPCPLNGGYSPWGAWSGCDADCGGGVRERTRFCTNPVPGWGGRHCEALGPSKVSELCNLAPCTG